MKDTTDMTGRRTAPDADGKGPLSRAARLRLTAALAVLGLWAALPSAAHAQVVLSQDFSGGNPVQSSDYALIDDGAYTLPGQYRVISDPASDFTNNYDSYFDHTQGTAAGAMLFFDGAADGTSRVWYDTATLSAGTTYAVSFWGSSGSGAAPPTLEMLVDDSALGSLTTTDATWTHFTAAYTPTVSGPHTFSIVDTGTVAFGNDGAVDDILVAAPAPEPSQTVALGLGALGLAGRALSARRRKLGAQP